MSTIPPAVLAGVFADTRLIALMNVTSGFEVACSFPWGWSWERAATTRHPSPNIRPETGAEPHWTCSRAAFRLDPTLVY